jgi:hypothetical protein
MQSMDCYLETGDNFSFPQYPSPSFAGSTRESMFAASLVGSMDCRIKYGNDNGGVLETVRRPKPPEEI